MLEWQRKVPRDPAYFGIDFKVSGMHKVRTVSMCMSGCPHGDVTLGGLKQTGNKWKLQRAFFQHKSAYIHRSQGIYSSKFCLYSALSSPCRFDSLVPMTSSPASPKIPLSLPFGAGQVRVLTHETEWQVAFPCNLPDSLSRVQVVELC